MGHGDKLRFAILHNGYIENDMGVNLSLCSAADRDDHHRPARWIKNPMFSVLIDHPKLGYILYDTSCAPGDDKDRLGDYIYRNFPMTIHPEDYVDQRLLSCGVKPEELSMIILSHMHFDHSGGLVFFSGTKAGQNIITGYADFAHALVESHTGKDVPQFYPRANLEIPGLRYQLIDDDLELADDVKLIMLPGHTPSLVGLMLHLESGTYLFPSDAAALKKNFGPPPENSIPPADIYDSLSYRKSLKKLNYLQQKYNATIIYSHDGIEYEKLKKAPEFYE